MKQRRNRLEYEKSRSPSKLVRRFAARGLSGLGDHPLGATAGLRARWDTGHRLARGHFWPFNRIPRLLLTVDHASFG